jgi:hypothetical protein
MRCARREDRRGRTPTAQIDGRFDATDIRISGPPIDPGQTRGELDRPTTRELLRAGRDAPAGLVDADGALTHAQRRLLTRCVSYSLKVEGGTRFMFNSHG